MGEHTPGPWHFVPWHIEEGQPAVRCAEGWIVATTSNDANAEFIARAPAMEARIAELEAERDELVRFKEDAILACAKHRCSKWEAALMDAEARAEKAEAEVERLRADAERYRELRRLATAWPQTVLVVNINIGHDWRTADAPEEIDSVVDAAIDAARGGDK